MPIKKDNPQFQSAFTSKLHQQSFSVEISSPLRLRFLNLRRCRWCLRSSRCDMLLQLPSRQDVQHLGHGSSKQELLGHLAEFFGIDGFWAGEIGVSLVKIHPKSPGFFR